VAEEQQEEKTADEQDVVAADESVKKKTANEAAVQTPASKLIYIVLGLNLVILAALAAFVWMNLSKSQSQVTLADIEGAQTQSTTSESTLSGDAKFIKEAFTVNLADTSGSHFAKVDVEIEIDDDFVREELIRLRPRIRDFIVVILSSKTYDQIASVDGRDFLREEIRNKINGYLTKGQIRNVYFTQFIIQ
jgi:flagellar protein FliL